MISFSLFFQGTINDSITYLLASLLDAALTEESVGHHTRESMKVLLVEQIQNVQRYSSQDRRGSVRVGSEGDTLFIETSNKIPASARLELGERLADLARQDKAALRLRFREVLKSPRNPVDHGPMLGLLLLAQKSSRPLSCQFIENQGGDPSFVLRSYVSQGRIDG